jgi:LPS-assembly lipoprotein
MWWHDRTAATAPLKAVLLLALAASLGGCFQPVYGERPTAGGGPSMKAVMGAVDVGQIDTPAGTTDSRLGVEVRNALLFGLTGGGPAPAPTHRLVINLRSTRLQVIVDITSSRPDLENYGINATYRLIEIASGKTVLTDTTFSRVSYDIPGQQQRFARSRGLRDAETRASQVIADNIRQRLASYFIAGS